MEQDNTNSQVQNPATITNETVTVNNQPRKKNSWRIATFVIAAVGACLIGLNIFQAIKLNQSDEESKKLILEVTSLREQLEQKAQNTSNISSNGTLSTKPSSSSSANNSNQNQDNSQKYLEPEGWNVRFAYPDGVTDVQYSTQDTPWDGVMFVTSVTKDGKTYNIDLFGGRESYQQYPFFFGEVARWDSVSPRDNWSGSIVDMDLIFTNGDYKYYAWSKGNGRESGDEAEYQEACRIVKALFDNAESK